MVLSTDDVYLWVATSNNSLARIKTENFQSREFNGDFGEITSMLIYKNFDLYIGNKNGDLCYIDGKNLYEEFLKSS